VGCSIGDWLLFWWLDNGSNWCTKGLEEAEQQCLELLGSCMQKQATQHYYFRNRKECLQRMGSVEGGVQTLNWWGSHQRPRKVCSLQNVDEYRWSSIMDR
jgi:hypothetical protein